jgi:cell division protein FtsB
MAAAKIIDTGKITTWLLGIALSFFAWFGKVTYDKLISMDEKLEMLLVQNGVNKTKIENIEAQIKEMQPCRNNNKGTSQVIVSEEAVLPNQEDSRKRYGLALK